MDSDLPAPPATYAAADAGEMAGAAPGIVGKASRAAGFETGDDGG
jgi:hypothetical protein